VPSSGQDNWVYIDLYSLIRPTLFGTGQRDSSPDAGMLNKKDTMRANASNDRYFPRVLGDIPLRDG